MCWNATYQNGGKAKRGAKEGVLWGRENCAILYIVDISVMNAAQQGSALSDSGKKQGSDNALAFGHMLQRPGSVAIALMKRPRTWRCLYEISLFPFA
jgi:hypothetical protein